MLKKVLDVISAANTLTLPMDVHRIAEHFGVLVYTYSLAQPLIETFKLQEMIARYPGVSVCFGKTHYIFLSDESNIEQERFTIAHELGHIALGHISSNVEQKVRTPEEAAEEEKQANLFALLLLAPAPLLDSLGAKTATEVHHHTGLSMADSRRAYLHLQDYRRDQHEAHRRDDIAHRARMAMQNVVPAQPSAPVDIPTLLSRPEVSIYIHQLLAATGAQEKAVG